METESEKRPYSVPEAASIAKTNVKTFYEAVRQGQVPSIRIGKRVLIPRAAFHRLLDEGN
jgi:excisionase family DNA binding protein